MIHTTEEASHSWGETFGRSEASKAGVWETIGRIMTRPESLKNYKNLDKPTFQENEKILLTCKKVEKLNKSTLCRFLLDTQYHVYGNVTQRPSWLSFWVDVKSALFFCKNCGVAKGYQLSRKDRAIGNNSLFSTLQLLPFKCSFLPKKEKLRMKITL